MDTGGLRSHFNIKTGGIDFVIRKLNEAEKVAEKLLIKLIKKKLTIHETEKATNSCRKNGDLCLQLQKNWKKLSSMVTGNTENYLINCHLGKMIYRHNV